MKGDVTSGGRNILAFGAAARPSRRRIEVRAGESGTVLLFTGVRYDRHANGSPAATSRAEQNHSPTPPLS